MEEEEGDEGGNIAALHLSCNDGETERVAPAGPCTVCAADPLVVL